MKKNTQLHISYTTDNQNFNINFSLPNTLGDTAQIFEHMEVQLTYQDLAVLPFQKQEKKT